MADGADPGQEFARQRDLLAANGSFFYVVLVRHLLCRTFLGPLGQEAALKVQTLRRHHREGGDFVRFQQQLAAVGELPCQQHAEQNCQRAEHSQ